ELRLADGQRLRAAGEVEDDAERVAVLAVELLIEFPARGRDGLFAPLEVFDDARANAARELHDALERRARALAALIQRAAADELAQLLGAEDAARRVDAEPRGQRFEPLAVRALVVERKGHVVHAFFEVEVHRLE